MVLTEAIQKAKKKSSSWCMDTASRGRKLLCNLIGKMIYGKKLLHSSLEPWWHGSYVVYLVTSSPVKLLGKTRWTY